jgi:uncharacterized protein (TIGR02996 family)
VARTSANDGLLSAVLADPHPDAPRRAYADWLEEKGDPRGELISLQLKKKKKPAELKREQALIAKHGPKWLGPLAPILVDPEFRRGFVASGTVRFNDRSEVEKFGSFPEWATLEELVWSHPSPIPPGEEPWCQFIGPAQRWLKKAEGIYGPHLLAAKSPWALEDAVLDPVGVDNFVRLFNNPLLPRLRRICADTTEFKASWLKGIKKLGPVEELSVYRRESFEGYLSAAAGLKGLKVLELEVHGHFRFSRGEDGALSKLTLRASPQHPWVADVVNDLPPGLVDTYVLEATDKGRFSKEVIAALELVSRRGRGK